MDVNQGLILTPLLSQYRSESSLQYPPYYKVLTLTGGNWNHSPALCEIWRLFSPFLSGGFSLCLSKFPPICVLIRTQPAGSSRTLSQSLEQYLSVQLPPFSAGLHSQVLCPMNSSPLGLKEFWTQRDLWPHSVSLLYNQEAEVVVRSSDWVPPLRDHCPVLSVIQCQKTIASCIYSLVLYLFQEGGVYPWYLKV